MTNAFFLLVSVFSLTVWIAVRSAQGREDCGAVFEESYAKSRSRRTRRVSVRVGVVCPREDRSIAFVLRNSEGLFGDTAGKLFKLLRGRISSRIALRSRELEYVRKRSRSHFCEPSDLVKLYTCSTVSQLG